MIYDEEDHHVQTGPRKVDDEDPWVEWMQHKGVRMNERQQKFV